MRCLVVALLLCGAAAVDVKHSESKHSESQGLLNSLDADLAAASRMRASNGLTVDVAHEKAKADAKGDFTFKFREAKNTVTDKAEHGQGNSFALMDKKFVENLVKSDDKLAGTLDTVAGFFGKQHGPMYQFLGEMLQLKLNGYRHVMNSKAKDTSQGRIITEWPGENTHSFLDNDQVVKRLKAVPQAQRDGIITRDNSLGLLRLGNWLWPDMGPNNAILLSSSVKDHEFYRPYLDYTVGNGAKKNWNYDDLLASAKAHLKKTRERVDDIQGSSFHVFNDVKLWTTKILFKAHLGNTGYFFKHEEPTGGIISDEEAQDFIGKQAKLVMLIVFPDALMTSALPKKAAGLSGLIEYRAKMVERIEAIVESNKALYPDPPRDPTLGKERKWTKCLGSPEPADCGKLSGEGWTAAAPLTEEAGNKKEDDCWFGRRKIACERPSPVPDGKRFSDGQRRLLASAIFDSLVFAGGLSVPSIISAAMGALYKKDSGITLQGGTAAERSKKIKQLVGEAARQYPGVVGFPVVPTARGFGQGKDILGEPVKDYLGPEWQKKHGEFVFDEATKKPDLKKHLQYRTAYILAAALRDTKVWGDDEAVFTLRDPKLYDDHLDVAWAFPSTVPAKAPNMPHLPTGLDPMSHGCPAKDLSYQMMLAFFEAWAGDDNMKGDRPWYQNEDLAEEVQRVAICHAKPEKVPWWKFWKKAGAETPCPAGSSKADIKYWKNGELKFANNRIQPFDTTPFFNDFILTQDSPETAKARAAAQAAARAKKFQAGEFGCMQDADCAAPSAKHKAKCFGATDKVAGKCRAKTGQLGPNTRCFEDFECQPTQKDKKHGVCEKTMPFSHKAKKLVGMSVEPIPGLCEGEYSNAGVEFPKPENQCAGAKAQDGCQACVEAGCAWCYSQPYARLAGERGSPFPAGQCAKTADVCPRGAQFYSSNTDPVPQVHGSGVEVIPYDFSHPEQCPATTSQLLKKSAAMLYPGEAGKATRQALASSAEPNERYWMMRPFLPDAHFDQTVDALCHTRMDEQTSLWDTTMYSSAVGERKRWNTQFEKDMAAHAMINKFETPDKFDKQAGTLFKSLRMADFGGIQICSNDEDWAPISMKEQTMRKVLNWGAADKRLWIPKSENEPHFFGGFSVKQFSGVVSGTGAMQGRSPVFMQASRDAESMAFFEAFYANTHPQSLCSWKLPEIQPDDMMWRFVASGIGLPLLRRKPLSGRKLKPDPKSHRTDDCFDATKVGGTPLPEGTAFCMDLKWQAGYKVRPAYERYGATAYFGAPDPKRGGVAKLLEIRRPKNEKGDFHEAPTPGKFAIYKPVPAACEGTTGGAKCTEAQRDAHADALDAWEHAKWVVRTSVMTEVTLIDHLLWAHLVVSNGVSNAAFRHLPPSHRIRQLLKPFTFRANTINFSAYLTLIAENGMADHWFGFTRAELARYMETGSKSFRYKDAIQIMNKMGLPEDKAARDKYVEGTAKVNVPLLHDGIKLYESFHAYTTEVVDILYTDEAAVKADAAINAYWTGLENSRLHQGRTADEYAFGLGPITKEALASQLAHMMFYVTGYHKLIGSLGDYMEGGARSVGLVIRPDYNEAAVIDMAGQNTLAAFTGFPQIDLINDWAYLYAMDGVAKSDDAHTKKLQDAQAKWQQNLIALSKTINEVNKEKRGFRATNYFNPQYLDSSIAI